MLGEVLLRLSPPRFERLLQSPRFDLMVGGAEANVAVSLAHFGHHTRLLSALPDHSVGRACVADIRKHGVDTRDVRLLPHGRVGLYFLAGGNGLIPSEVIYDRQGSTFATTANEPLDWDRALAHANWLHVSGVTPALGAECTTLTLTALRAARSRGIQVSFDCNYRAKLWDAWGGDAASTLRACAAEADLLFADERALAMLLGVAQPKDELTDELLASLAARAFSALPHLQRVAATRRIEHSADQHELSGTLITRKGANTSRRWSLTNIVDRIGSGDAFAAGLLHGIQSGTAAQECIEFAVAAACLKHSIPGDANLASVAEVRDLIAGAGFGVRR
jgi:2-dehydro-3-deoxygluconokinase